MSGNTSVISKMLATTRSKVIFCVAGVGFSLLMLLMTFGPMLARYIPSETRLEKMQQDLEDLRKSADANMVKLTALNQSESLYRQHRDEAWLPERDGEPEVALREKLEAAATDQDLKFNTISTVRRSKINAELSFLEVDITMNESIGNLLKVLTALDSMSPKIYFRRADFRPDNSVASGNLFFSGALRLMCVESEDAATASGNTGALAASTGKGGTQ